MHDLYRDYDRACPSEGEGGSGARRIFIINTWRCSLTRGRISNQDQRLRERAEEIQAGLALAALDLDEIRLRQSQALRRFPVLSNVLDPAIVRLGEIEREVRQAHRLVGEIWQETRSP